MSETKSTKIVDEATGITVIKGGSAANVGIFQAVQDAYTNITQNGIATIAFALVTLITIAEVNSTDGPLELMNDSLKKIVEDKTEPQFMIVLASALSKLLTFLILHKIKFIYISWMWLPYSVKPSSKNLYVSLFLSLFVLFAKALELLEVVSISNLYFLWASVRNPTHKFVFLIACLAVMLISLELNFGMTKRSPDVETTTKHSRRRRTVSEYDPTPNPFVPQPPVIVV